MLQLVGEGNFTASADSSSTKNHILFAGMPSWSTSACRHSPVSKRQVISRKQSAKTCDSRSNVQSVYFAKKSTFCNCCSSTRINTAECKWLGPGVVASADAESGTSSEPYGTPLQPHLLGCYRISRARLGGLLCALYVGLQCAKRLRTQIYASSVHIGEAFR